MAQRIRGDLLASLRFVGPISWHIDTADYDLWRLDPAEAAAEIYGKIEGSSGIVLMHDSIASDPYLMSTNRTYEILTHLIPMLQDAGYAFGKLEQIDELRRMIDKPLVFSLQATKSDAAFWLAVDDTGAVRLTNGANAGSWEKLEAEPIGGNRVAIKCAADHSFAGQYLAVDQGNGLVRLTDTCDESCVFEVVELESASGARSYAFATFNEYAGRIGVTKRRSNLLRYADGDDPNSVIDANGSTDLENETVFTFINRSY